MDTKLILGFVFMLNAWTLSVLVGPWYLGLPFLAVGLLYLGQGVKASHSTSEKSEHKKERKNDL